MSKLKLLRSLKLLTFIHLNFLSKKVFRDKNCFIVPYWGARYELSKTSKIVLHKSLIIGSNRYPHSHTETYLRIRKGATLVVNGRLNMMYGATLEVHQDANIAVGNSTIQTGAVIVCAYKINIGEGCLFGRMSYVSDSDHHRTYDEEGNTTNFPREIIIGDNVWVGVGATVMKGCNIKSGSIIGAGSMAFGRVKEHSLIMREPDRQFGNVIWDVKGFS